MAVGVSGCDCKHLGGGYDQVEQVKAKATVTHIKFLQKLDHQR